jgi:outer membrane biosynthesis protein TonB
MTAADQHLEQNEDSFRKFVVVSIAAHLAIFFAVSIKNFFISSENIVIPPSMRVDLVALPDKVTEPIAPSKPAPAAPAKSAPVKPLNKPEPKPEPKLNVKDLQKKALEKLKAQSALDRIKNEVDAAQAKPATTKQNTPPAQEVRGNIISSGSSFSGLSQLRVNEYLEDVKSRVSEHWSLPQWLKDAPLKASVVIMIDDRGLLVRREIYTSSGNSVFDASCLAAVADSAPFSPPPGELKSRLIMVRFPFE